MSIYYDLKRKAYLNTLGAVISALATLLFLWGWGYWGLIVGGIITLIFTGFAITYRMQANDTFETQ